MPILTFVQAIMSRVIVGIVVILTAIGLGSLSDSPTNPIVDKEPTQEIEEIVILTEKTEELAPESTPTEDNLPAGGEKILINEENSPTSTSGDGEEITPTPSPADVSSTEEGTEAVVNPPPTPDVKLPLSFTQINTETAEVLVNILCSQNIAGAVNPITGSGVIIDPRGVVITNAHVAQFFLLKDYPAENGLQCVLRTGSPARNKYTAELLYISPEWVGLHASDITNPEPKGTGEHDYAFLRITGRTDPNAELPTTFPFISVDINDNDIKTGNQTLVAAYPAGFLGGTSIQRDLYSVSSVATVGERFTFLENTIDLFSIGGTVVSQGGSSGGAVVSNENKLIGVIVTSTKADTTAERDLRAITLGHINRALTEGANTTIEGLLFGDVVLKAKLFNLSTTPSLINLYLQYLVK